MYILVRVSKLQADALKKEATARRTSVATLGGVVLGAFIAGRFGYAPKTKVCAAGGHVKLSTVESGGCAG